MPRVANKKLIKKTNLVKPQPQDIVAEEAVLGSILINNEVLSKVKEYIHTPEVFYLKSNKIIWNKIDELGSQHESIDYVTVFSRLNESEKTEVDKYQVMTYADNIPTTANVEHYAKIVLEKYLQRKLIESTYNVQSAAFDNTKEFSSILKEIKLTTDELTQLQPYRQPKLNEIMDSAISSIMTADNYINFGFQPLDNLAGGMTRGEITVVAGRPGHGKTTFVVNLVPKLIDQGLKVLVMNREMTNEEMLKKIIVLESGSLSYRAVRTNQLDKDSIDILNETKEKVLEKYRDNLIMVDSAKDLNSAITHITRNKPDVVIDDYIQLIQIDGYDQRRFELEAIMNEYKWIAKTYELVPILVSQLNREIERRIDPVPKMSDLAESGSIEQVAENILFVYYDYKVHYEESDLGKFKSQIVAAKVRYGENRKLTLGFDGDKVLFHGNVNTPTPEPESSDESEEIKDMLKRVKQIGITMN
jgi:replicative DNA helicase